MVKIFGFEFGKKDAIAPDSNVVTLAELDSYIPGASTMLSPTSYTGDKFAGGYGHTKTHTIDYWTLRKRSAELFTDNLYARGLLRRLITNEINTGLTPEATPDEPILGLEEDSLNEWTENVENRFNIWSKDARLCDYKHADTFGALQRAARLEALVTGDCLVVLRQSQRTGLPQVQLISGNMVQTPYDNRQTLRKGHKVLHGVEFDNMGRVAAHWVRKEDFTFVRIPAWGEKSGRQLSWLVYGTDRRMDEVRGQPILSLVLQSLKEIDRYRDSAQRKAVVNSILAMFIKKSADKPGTLPMTGGATRKGAVMSQDSSAAEPRSYNIAEQIPGVVMEELQQGEEPVGFHSQGTDLNFGTFEDAILQSIAWANEMPPEILRLSFSSNYSASQAAINEFKAYLSKQWAIWGETFCTPIYIDWLISETLQTRIKAPQLIDAWRDPLQYDIFGAWTGVEWYGNVKPSMNMRQSAQASQLLVDEGWSTNAREARGINGTKFSQNIKRLRRENELKAEAARPIVEFRRQFGQSPDEVIADKDI